MKKLSPHQAAVVIGCCVSHVRGLIRRGVLKAERVATDANQHGYRYVITQQEAERYRDSPQTGVGWRRGRSRV